jgi:hypothetical protein
MSALGRKARGLALGGLAAATLSAQAWAYPGCNLSDIINDAGNTIGGIGSSQCVSSFATGGEVAVGVVTGVLTAAALSGAGGGVDSLCGDVKGVADSATNVGQWLQQAGGSMEDLGNLLSSLQGADPLNVAICACNLEQGVDSLVSDLGDCFCDVANFFGVGSLFGCNACTPPPPIQANCALPANCYVGSSDPACQGNVIAACPTPTSTGGLGGLGNLFGGSSGGAGGLPGLFGLGPACPASVQNGPTGAFASTTTRDPNCPQVLFCFCPKPLVPTWTTPPPGPPPGQQCTSGSCFPWPTGPAIFTCACPPGTSQSGVAGGLPVCRCPYTGVQPVATDDPSQMCPPVNILGSCQPNQVVVNGKCVTPCSDPGMGMTPDGACCDPNLMTSCGECCKSGTIPVNGTCVAPGTSQ